MPEKLPRSSAFEALASDEARVAIESYLKAVHSADTTTRERADFSDHAYRVQRILHTYADDLIAPQVYDYALLHDVAIRALDGQLPKVLQLNARSAICGYLKLGQSDDTESAAASCIFGDFEAIDTVADKWFDDLEFPGFGRKSSKHPLACDERGRISVELWEQDPPAVNLERLSGLVRGVNIESILIKTSEIIDRLTNPTGDEATLFGMVNKAETLYGPVCEAMGLDAFAIKLYSESTKRRYEKCGRHEHLERAEQIRKNAQHTRIYDVSQELFGRISYDYVPGQLDYSDESSVFSSVNVDDPVLGAFVMRYRLKSIGSLAKKLRKLSRDVMPMDVHGATIVQTDIEQMAFTFAEVLSRVEAHSGFSLQAAPSKERAVYVQGNCAYVDQVRPVLKAIGMADAQYEELESVPTTYNVCKFTSFITNNGRTSPLEMQFVTAADRKSARIGEAAHIVYKMKLEKPPDSDDLVRFLGDIYERRDCIDKGTLEINPASLSRGVDWLKRLRT